MADMNVAIYSGRLVKDVELSPNGKIAKGTIACNRAKKQDNGKWKDEPSFLDLKWFNREGLYQYLKKGTPVVVECETVQERWTGKDGKEYSRIMQYVGNTLLNSTMGGQKDDKAKAEAVPEVQGNEEIPF